MINLFSSHSWAHGAHRVGLHNILSPWARGVDFQDYSISRAHPLGTDTDPELARELRDIIRRMDALLIMAGMYANNSSWMQFEIITAFNFDVPIIPVLANGQQRVPRLPTRLATVPPVRWRGDSIREALLSCVTPERRQAIEAQVRNRAAAGVSRSARPIRPVNALRSFPFGRPFPSSYEGTLLDLVEEIPPPLPVQPRNMLAKLLAEELSLPNNLRRR